MESLDPSPQPSPPPTFTRRGGCLGAMVIYALSLGMIMAAFLPTMYRERLGWSSLTTPESFRVLLIALQLSFVAALIGYFAGREGARCASVNGAFLRGGILCGLATLICLLALFSLPSAPRAFTLPASSSSAPRCLPCSPPRDHWYPGWRQSSSATAASSAAPGRFLNSLCKRFSSSSPS